MLISRLDFLRLVIRQLVVLSGKKGIEAFLPHVDRVAKFSFSESSQPLVDDDDDRDPFLPLGSSWEQIDFSPKSVLAPWAKELSNDTEAPTGKHEHRRGEKMTPQSRQGSVNVREWVMRAMARYRFVLGTSFDSPCRHYHLFAQLDIRGRCANQYSSWSLAFICMQARPPLSL